MKRQQHAPPPSRHSHDLWALRPAAQTAPRARVVAAPRPPAAAAAPVVAYTFNWQAGPDESALVPRRLGPDELPECPQPAVRALIQCTAAGRATSAELRQQLLTVDATTLDAAIRAGIHRWHTYQR
jgi:hypothetical protein